MITPCCLCAQMRGEPELDLLHEYLGGQAYRRRLVELGHDWYAMPSIGSLVPGHTLLCPFDHVRSYAALGRATMVDLCPRLDRLAAGLGGRVQVFEHGNAKTGSQVACSVEHAHLHVVPKGPDMWPHIDARLEWEALEGGLPGLAASVGTDEYLLYGDLSGRYWVARASDRGHASQILRRALATAVGQPEQWNWRAHPRLRDTEASLRALTRV
jgi:ATP adenylyltransferase